MTTEDQPGSMAGLSTCFPLEVNKAQMLCFAKVEQFRTAAQMFSAINPHRPTLFNPSQ